MNLEEEIVRNLEKSGFDDFTKIRYIYQYVCNKFSYDVRFIFARESLKDEIYNKKVDITNIEDFEIVCYTCARILVDILLLFNFKAEIVSNSSGKFRHVSVRVKCGDRILELDPTKTHDIARVKMNSPTYDFKPLIDDCSFEDQLSEADEQILQYFGQKTDPFILYNKQTILELVETLEKSARERNISKEELFFEKMEAIVCLVNTRTDFKRYDDIDYYLSYLIHKLDMNSGGFRIRSGVFFKIDDDSMKDMINIILIENDLLLPIFYIMEKVGDNFKIRPIQANEVIEKLDEYSNWQIDYRFRGPAERAVARKI